MPCGASPPRETHRDAVLAKTNHATGLSRGGGRRSDTVFHAGAAGGQAPRATAQAGRRPHTGSVSSQEAIGSMKGASGSRRTRQRLPTGPRHSFLPGKREGRTSRHAPESPEHTLLFPRRTQLSLLRSSAASSRSRQTARAFRALLKAALSSQSARHTAIGWPWPGARARRGRRSPPRPALGSRAQHVAPVSAQASE